MRVNASVLLLLSRQPNEKRSPTLQLVLQAGSLLYALSTNSRRLSNSA